MFESNATSEQYNAIEDQRRTFHVLTRTVGVPRIGDYIRIREVELNPTSGGAVPAPTGRELYARVKYVEPLSASGINASLSTVAIHGWVLGIELRISSTKRMPAVRTE